MGSKCPRHMQDSLLQSLKWSSQRSEIMCYLVLEISVVSVVTGEVIFYVLDVVCKVSVASDEIISGIQN